MDKIWRSLLFFGLTSTLAVQLSNAEPPVTNYMSNYYEPSYTEDHESHEGHNHHHRPHHHYQPPSNRIHPGHPHYHTHRQDDVPSPALPVPQEVGSQEKGQTGKGYVSSSRIPAEQQQPEEEEDEEEQYELPTPKLPNFTLPPLKIGISNHKGHYRGPSPSYGSYRPSKKGNSWGRPSYGPPSSGKGKGPRPIKYGRPGGSKGSPNPSSYSKPTSDENSYTGGQSQEEEPASPASPPGPSPSNEGPSGSDMGYPQGVIEDTPGGYVPSAGYQPGSWINTMKGGYDDYGYNDHSPKAPGYKGNGQGKIYSYNPPSLSEHPSSQPEFSPSHSYGDDHEEEGEHKRPSPPSYSSSSKGTRRPPSNGYGQNPYFTSFKSGPPVKSSSPSKSKGPYNSNRSRPKPSYGPPKKKYSSSSKGYINRSYRPSSSYGHGGPPRSSYEVPSSSYGTPSNSYGYGGSSYGSPTTYSRSSPAGKDDDYSNYYRTRSGSFARRPPVVRPMPGYTYKYTTIGKSNAPHVKSRQELENGHSENYGRYNWENEGWTVTH